jgi:hypothetical protein
MENKIPSLSETETEKAKRQRDKSLIKRVFMLGKEVYTVLRIPFSASSSRYDFHSPSESYTRTHKSQVKFGQEEMRKKN